MTSVHHDDHHQRHLVLTAAVGAGLVAYLTGSVTSVYGFDLAMVLALAGGFPIFSEAVRALGRRKLSADLAVALAALAALAIGQYAVAAEVILIMLIGEVLEHFAVGRTRAGIAELLSLRPHTARVRRDGAEGEEEALKIRAEADKQRTVLLAQAYAEAEKTRGAAEAEAIKTYAAAHQKDPAFYELLRTLEAYRKMLDSKTTILLSADSDLLKYLTHGADPAKANEEK